MEPIRPTNRQYHQINDNKDAIKMWLRYHLDIIHTEVAFCTDIDELTRNAAKLNVIRMLDSDVNNILSNLSK